MADTRVGTARIISLERRIRELEHANKSLSARLEGAHQFACGDAGWVYKPQCRCRFCAETRQGIDSVQVAK